VPFAARLPRCANSGAVVRRAARPRCVGHRAARGRGPHTLTPTRLCARTAAGRTRHYQGGALRLATLLDPSRLGHSPSRQARPHGPVGRASCCPSRNWQGEHRSRPQASRRHVRHLARRYRLLRHSSSQHAPLTIAGPQVLEQKPSRGGERAKLRLGVDSVDNPVPSIASHQRISIIASLRTRIVDLRRHLAPFTSKQSLSVERRSNTKHPIALSPCTRRHFIVAA
jgi:hypothetical protein